MGRSCGGDPKRYSTWFLLPSFEREILQSNLPQNAKLRETSRLARAIFGRIHVINEVTDEPEPWQWQEESKHRLLSGGDEFRGILYHWAREPRRSVLSLNGKIFDKHLFRRKARGCLDNEVRLPQQLPISFQFSLEIQFNLEIACLPKENSAVYIPMVPSDWLLIYHMFWVFIAS